jgi:TfoX/Sxy family transcriptional regulator of competence genes
MAYDEGLATRIQELLPHGQEKKMFGGWGLMHRGNLVVGVIGDDMIARVGP